MGGGKVCAMGKLDGSLATTLRLSLEVLFIVYTPSVVLRPLEILA